MPARISERPAHIPPSPRQRPPKTPNQRCRLCQELIRGDATACSHCGHFLSPFRVTFREFIYPLALVLISLCLPLWWQYLEQQRLNDQLIVGLKIELSQNMAALNNAESVLKDDLKSLGAAGNPDIRPLLDLRFGTWEKTQFGSGNLLAKLVRTDTAGFMKLTYCYSILRLLQEKIENREIYRYLHEGKPWFTERLKVLDNDLIEKLDHAKKVVGTAQEYFDRIHKWKVTGESFSVEAGLVTTSPMKK